FGSKTIIQCKQFVGSGFSKLLGHLKKDEAPNTVAKASVEFLNSSIKDFISGEITANPERLIDLIQTSLRFQQLVTLWRWSRQSKARGIRAAISAASEKFMSAVEAAIARPYRQVIPLEGGRAERGLDIYPE